MCSVYNCKKRVLFFTYLDKILFIFFDKNDIYILDHDSDDNSTTELDVNVVNIHNTLAFDHQWLVDTVQDFQQKLLEKYKCVLFSESDITYLYHRLAINKLMRINVN